MNAVRRLLAAVVTGAVISLLSACSAAQPEPTTRVVVVYVTQPPVTPLVIYATAPPVISTLAPIASPDPSGAGSRNKVTLSGVGSVYTKKFALAGDYSITFSGKSLDSYGGNVDLYLQGTKVVGLPGDLLVNDIVSGVGPYKFTTIRYGIVPADDYYLNVSVPAYQSPWTIVFEPIN